MTSSAPVRHWAAIPAGGSGRRMAGTLPKQYLPLAGRSVIEHTVERLGNHPRISGVVVAVSAGSAHWSSLRPSARAPILTAPAGEERCHSVLNALQRLREMASSQDWVLVHDAVRPCVRREDLDRLMREVAEDEVGGLLALPVTDTLKRADPQGRVLETVDRAGLWRAATPQMFRLDALSQALKTAIEEGVTVTDEAAAMERAGLRPRLVPGHGDNIKITYPQDLALAELFLKQQAAE
jgi:2-C-methyl-D-erythritol 4-phosphate cytidylyltransferase